MAVADRARRLARLEDAVRCGRGGAEVDALRREVGALTAECERAVDDRAFCDLYLRLVEAGIRLAEASPEPAWTPVPGVEEMTDAEVEALLNARRDRRHDHIHARFREVATDAEVDRYLAMAQERGRDRVQA